MLVYYNIPKGYSSLGHKHIEGYATGKPPTHVSHKEFMGAKQILIQAPFTPEYIESKYNKPNFPYRAYFTLDMIRDIQYRDLQKIATYLDIDALLPYTNLIYCVRNALKDL